MITYARAPVLALAVLVASLVVSSHGLNLTSEASGNGVDHCLGCEDQSFPPAGSDQMNLTAHVTIDLSPIDLGTETVEMSGDTIVERGGPKIGAGGSTIPIEIVQLQLTGTSNLLGPGTPVMLDLNENAGPAQGTVQDQNPDPAIDFPAEGQRSLPFLDLRIGAFDHFLNGNLELQSSRIVRIPYLGSHWESGEIDLQIIDFNSEPARVVGFVREVVIWYEGVFSITVLKLNDATHGPISRWEMELFANEDCSGDPIDSGLTNDDGLIDFTGLSAGVYSVREAENPLFAPKDGSLCREDIAVPGPSETAGLIGFADCPVLNQAFPEPGCDSFDSGGQVNVQLASGGEPFTITLNGPTTVHRKTAPQDETAFPSAAASSSGLATNGLDEVETEIIQLDLAGASMFGTITVEEAPDRESTGMFEEQANSAMGEMDFPANSFFDIFVHIHIPGVGVGTLYNAEPMRMECVIFGIPPFLCLYQPPVDDPIELYRLDNDDLFAYIVHAAHVPLPPDEVFVVFRNVPVEKPLIQGDFDCDQLVEIADALVLMFYLAGLTPSQQPSCPALGDGVVIAGVALVFGDVNCDGEINAFDVLALLHFVANLPYTQPDGCPDILDP